MTIGEQFRAIRLQRGLSAMQVAKKADMKYDHYLDIERNRRPYPRQATIDRIAEALEVKVEVVVTDNSERIPFYP